MSTKGKAESYIKLRGSLRIPDVIHGKSAYEIAVMNGFNGTEKEWLDLLMVGDRLQAKIVNVSILASRWEGEASPYSQVVVIDGITENTKVDLLPSVEQLAIFHNKDLAFVTENDDGIVTVYAIGQKPLNDYIIQAMISEVKTWVEE